MAGHQQTADADCNTQKHTASSSTDHEDNSALKRESIWYGLPPDISTIVLLFLGDIDWCGYLKQVAKIHPFRANELVYRFLCEHIYPAQTRLGKLQVEKWRTWEQMAIHRPRLRTNGVYSLRTLFTRAPCNDNFWEEKRVESIEVKYYRHMRFFDHGRMLYSMDIKSPSEIIKPFDTFNPTYKHVFEGRYVLMGRDLIVEVVLHYCIVKFRLMLLDGDDGFIGKHNMLTIIEHSSTLLPYHLKQTMTSATLATQNGIGFTKAIQSTVNHAVQEYYRHEPLIIPNTEPIQYPHVDPTGTVFYRLPVNSNLRFYRQWNWQPGIEPLVD